MAEHALDMQDDFTADGLRRMANRHFVEQNYDSALSLYSLAVGKASIQSSVTNSGGRTGIVFVGEADSSISQNVNLTDDAPSVVIHLCNRSACLFKMGRFDESAKDAATAFQLSDGTFYTLDGNEVIANVIWPYVFSKAHYFIERLLRHFFGMVLHFRSKRQGSFSISQSSNRIEPIRRCRLYIRYDYPISRYVTY